MNEIRTQHSTQFKKLSDTVVGRKDKFNNFMYM
jgi:hypothetical protein